MERSEDVAEHFDSQAARYDESPLHQSLAAAVATFAKLESIPDVLDVATGTGLVLRELESLKKIKATGVDISDGMLSIARQMLPNATLKHADAATLPFSDASFDLITCVTAITLLPDPDAALIEWNRVLRPDGRLILGTFAVDDPKANWKGGSRPPHGHTSVSENARFGTLEGLTAFGAGGGMYLLRCEPWSHPSVEKPQDVCLLSEFA